MFCFEISAFDLMRTLEEHSQDYAILSYMSYTTTAASLFGCYVSNLVYQFVDEEIDYLMLPKNKCIIL